MRLYKTLMVQDAFTLSELMVVVIIVGILASLAIPLFSRAIENTKAKEAIAALEQIRSAQRIYRVEENTYWGPEPDDQTINATLSLDLDISDDRNWDYSIDSAGPDSFETSALRLEGAHKDEKIVINQDGLVPGQSTWTLPLPGQ